MTKFSRALSWSLMAPEGRGVPAEVRIFDDNCRQGAVVQNHPEYYGPQTIVQYYTGDGYRSYVCLLDFENWEATACPRFAYYILTEQDGDSNYYVLCADVSEAFDWSLVN